MKTNFLLRAKDFYRFYSKINRLEGDDACWLWTGGKSIYGRFWLNGKYEGAQRVAYAQAYGDFDPKLLVLHKKDSPRCCRPDHLWLGNHQDNTHDMIAKGRGLVGRSYNLGNTWNRGEKCGNAKLTNAQALEIRALYKGGALTHEKISWRYKVSRPTISDVVNRRTFKYI